MLSTVADMALDKIERSAENLDPADRSQNSCDLRLLFAVFRLAARDWLGVGCLSVYDRHIAGKFLSHRNCRELLKACGVPDPAQALIALVKLRKAGESA